MAKMNRTLRMGKTVVGYKSVTPIKGTTDSYKITTTPGPTEATVTNSSGEVVGVVTGSTLKELVKKIKEGLVSLGVKFPILQAEDIPFAPQTELQYLTSWPTDKNWQLYSGNGIIHYGDESLELPIYYHIVNAESLQEMLRYIPGLENAEVIEIAPRSFSISVPAGSPLMTFDSNYLEHDLVHILKFESQPITGTYQISGTLDEEPFTTAEIPADAEAEDIQLALGDVGFFVEVTGSGLEFNIAPLFSLEPLELVNNTTGIEASLESDDITTPVQVFIENTPPGGGQGGNGGNH